MSSETAKLPGGGADRESKPLPAMRQILRVRTHGAQIAIDLGYVRRVLPLMELEQLPGAPSHLAGLMNYRGDSLPVVDVGIWLGMKMGEPYELTNPIVICGDGVTEIGLLVSDIIQVEAVAEAEIEAKAAFLGTESPFVASVNSAEGPTLLLDIKRILSTNVLDVNPGISANADLPAENPNP